MKLLNSRAFALGLLLGLIVGYLVMRQLLSEKPTPPDGSEPNAALPPLEVIRPKKTA